MSDNTDLVWHRILAPDELPKGRVRAVVADGVSLAHFEGTYSALANACPHQGGPLGEGSIENGWLRCPWHDHHYRGGSRRVSAVSMAR